MSLLVTLPSLSRSQRARDERVSARSGLHVSIAPHPITEVTEVTKEPLFETRQPRFRGSWRSPVVARKRHSKCP